MDQKTIEMIMELTKEVKLVPIFQPAVRELIDGLRVYSEEYTDVVNWISKETVRVHKMMFEEYMKAGFTAEQALTLLVEKIRTTPLQLGKR